MIEHVAASTSNVTHHAEVTQGSSPIILRQDGLLADRDQLSLATRSRTPDESPNSIVLESPQAELQTGNLHVCL